MNGIDDKNPFPMTRERLVERITNGFPAGYLTSLSIIQGVVFGVLILNAVPAVGQQLKFGTLTTLSTVLLVVIPFCNLIIVWSEYSWFTRHYIFLPTFVDAAMPFMIGAAQVMPMFFFDSIEWYPFAAIVLPVTGIFAWGNTLYHTTDNMFEHNQPDIQKRCYRLFSRRLMFVMGLMPFSVGAVLLVRLLPYQMGDILLSALYSAIFIVMHACIVWSTSEMTDEVLKLYEIRSGNLKRPLHSFWHKIKWLSVESCVGSSRLSPEKRIDH